MASVSNIQHGKERKVHLPSPSPYSAYPRFPPTCPIYTYQPTPFMIYHIRDPIIPLLDPCTLRRTKYHLPIPLTKWMCRLTTTPTEITWIKSPLQTTANLLDAIQAKLDLCHYRLPQRFLFLYRIRSSYDCLLGLPQQGCKCFSFFRVAVCERRLWILSCPLDSIGMPILLKEYQLYGLQDQDGSWLRFSFRRPNSIVPSFPTPDPTTYPQTVADNQKQWKDIRAKYTEAVEE
jgi:hypothetical protein